MLEKAHFSDRTFVPQGKAGPDPRPCLLLLQNVTQKDQEQKLEEEVFQF